MLARSVVALCFRSLASCTSAWPLAASGLRGSRNLKTKSRQIALSLAVSRSVCTAAADGAGGGTGDKSQLTCGW